MELASGWNFPGLHSSHAPMLTRGRLLGAARWREVAHDGLRAPTAAGEVGGAGVRALNARQRRAGTLWTVRAQLAGNARLLALHGLVLAGRALVARALACDGLDGAGAARRLLGAARWREVAHVGLGALVGAGEVGGDGVRALRARQRRAGTLRAVRPGLAGDARLLALVGLILAGRAPVARGHARAWRDRAGAASTRLRRARTARRTRWALQAVVGARHREVEQQNRLVLVRAGLARQRGRRALRTVRAGRARPAHQLTRRGLEGAGLALETRAHACVWRNRAGAALGLLRAARWREVAHGGLRAPTAAGEVGGAGVRAFLARQRRARARWAVRARLAGDARLLALFGLVRACRAPVARALACDGLDGAGATLGLLGAARRCIVARTSRRALISAAQVSGARVRPLAARQWRRRALRAVRARHAHVALGPAGYVHELACAALVARGLLAQRLHGTRAARRRIGAARGCVRAWQGWSALAIGAEVGLVGVRARRARQHGPGTLGAVRAGHASNTRLLALVGLVRTSRAPVACAHACVRLNGARAAPGRLDAASRCVGSWRCIFATISTVEAGEIAPCATGARYTPHAPRLAVAALLACGRSDSGRCSAHVAGRAEGGA
eukprot:scaffold31688_cov73-Phaeocystis_antarctica.AAC.2